MLKWYLVQVIPTSVNIQDSRLAIKALHPLKPNNLKLAPIQEQLVKFISNKRISANPPRPQTSSWSLHPPMSSSSFQVGSSSSPTMKSGVQKSNSLLLSSSESGGVGKDVVVICGAAQSHNRKF
ncbi:hypothetical protein DSO57_1017625 [Entomophthora muscae]|uniref:Uncharacterized protein n=1 Tax=Entomophthora muscae TaxID=34485 RepID=A0ACC2RVP1_9FUNG|nr:hypothetical protein DSO57_1017625 [Entomophthora muscae]